MRIDAAILTISDKGSKGEREDVSGATARRILEGSGFRIQLYCIVPDEVEEIKKKLVEWSDSLCMPLIVTTGGTGVSDRDVTPEATGAVLEKELPGFGEAMRASGLRLTPYAILSRGKAGIRKRSLIINLPGNPKAVEENLLVVLPILGHAIAKISGDREDCAHLREKV
ncbi:MAG: MogA/MoaB family molybdenum cofactor biosynthesis protein [Nitrospinae bacterium]|nr:MogA/MoaB family molybdenum cofactor biosynthesis protein [Nitrospinota bacterium]